MVLRKCIDCGLEASERELGLFVLDRSAKYGRQNLCRKCRSKRIHQRRREDIRFILKHRFQNMKQRCYNLNDRSYCNYGGRGIIICQEWLDDPEVFIDWAIANGFKRDLSIDRINDDGPYSSENCRWVTPNESNRNTRSIVTNFEKATRICSKCKVEKSLTEFYRDRTLSMGRKYVCKDCWSKSK